MIQRLSDDRGVDEKATHRELNQIDAEANLQMPRTEEYVSLVIDLVQERLAALEAQNRSYRHAEARNNVLMASQVLSREYPYTEKSGDVYRKTQLGLQLAANLLSKELSLLDGEYPDHRTDGS